MAFIRKKVVKGRTYYPVVENIRNKETGKVEQKTIFNLGSDPSVILGMIPKIMASYPNIRIDISSLKKDVAGNRLRQFKKDLPEWQKKELNEFIRKIELYFGNIEKSKSDSNTKESIFGMIRALDEQYVKEFSFPREVLQNVRNDIFQGLHYIDVLESDEMPIKRQKLK